MVGSLNRRSTPEGPAFGLPVSSSLPKVCLQTPDRYPSQSTMNTITSNSVPTPHPCLLIPSLPNLAATRAPRKSFPSGDPLAAAQAYGKKKAEWAKLPLRQQFADEGVMREHLSTAGLRIINSTEPASVTRVRCLLRRAGVQGPETEASIGTDIAGYLTLNPLLPLWAAVALILEATGRFAAQAIEPTA